MAKDQKSNSSSDLPSGNAPSMLPAPGYPLSPQESGRFKKAEVLFQRACARIDELVKKISEKIATDDSEVPVKTDALFADYVNQQFFRLHQECKKDLFKDVHAKYLNKVDFGFQLKFENSLEILKTNYHQKRLDQFLNGVKDLTKEFKEAIVTKDAAFSDVLKTEESLLTTFQFQVGRRREEAKAMFEGFKPEFRDNAEKALGEIVDHSRLLLRATYGKGTFQSSVLDTPIPGRLNPPTDEHKTVASFELEAMGSQPIMSDEATEAKRTSVSRQYVTKVWGMNAAEMEKKLKESYASSEQLKELFPEFLHFFIGVGAELAVKQKIDSDISRAEELSRTETNDWQLKSREAEFDALAAKLDEENYSALAQALGGNIFDEWKRDVDALYSDWDAAIYHNNQLALGAEMAEGSGTMYDELSEMLGGTMYDELSKSLGGNIWDELSRDIDTLYGDWNAACYHNNQLNEGASLVNGLGTMYDELAERLTAEHLDAWSNELELEAGQNWSEHYHDEWAADLSAAAKTPKTKSLLERVQESQKYTNLSQEEYQHVKDTIVANILPDAKFIAALPYDDAANKWISITQGLRAKLVEYVDKGDYSEGDFQEFLEDEVQTLEFLIVTKVGKESSKPSSASVEPVPDAVCAVDALFDEDFETRGYESNIAEISVIPIIDDSPVATIPKALYSPSVEVSNSQRSDEKGPEATITRVTPMTTQKDAADSQNTSIVSNLYRLVEDRLNIKKTEWKTLLTESTFEKPLDTENSLETEMALFISNIEHADGTSITQGMSNLPKDQQMDMYHALVNYGVDYLINRKEQVKSALETKLTPEPSSEWIVEPNTKKYSPVKVTSTESSQPKSYMGKILIGLGLAAGAVTLGLVIKSCEEKQEQNYKQEIVQKAEEKAEAAKAETKAEFVATHSTLENYLSSFYLNDIEGAHKMWPAVEAQFPHPGVSTDVQPVYTQFTAELNTARSPKDALMTFRSYRSFLQQDLNNGSLTKNQFDASLGQALRDLNKGEYK